MNKQPIRRPVIGRVNRPVVILAAIMFCALAYQGQAIRNLQHDPSAVGVVNIERLFNNLDAKSVADAELESQANELQRQADLKLDDLQALEEDIELFSARQ